MRNTNASERMIAWLSLVLLLLSSACDRKQTGGAVAAAESTESPASPASKVGGPTPAEDSSAKPPSGDAAGIAPAPNHDSNTPQVPVDAPKGGSQGLLWKVTAPKGAAFLLGSIHVGKKDLYPLRPLIEESFMQADALVVEVDTADQALAAMTMMQAGTYPAGETLKSHISASLWKQLEVAAAKAGLPMALVSSMRPWLVSVTLMAKDIQDIGYEPKYGIDVHFMDQARKRKMKLIALETVQQQINALADHDAATQELMLRETIEESAAIGEIMKRVTKAWRDGDAKDVEEFLMGTMAQPEYASLYKGLFIDRNVLMEKKIGAMLDRGGVYFVVIGAGHLVAKDSVLDLLRKHGRNVERL